MRSPNELLETILKQTTDNIYCSCPCQVVSVDGNYVDAEIYINDDYPNMVLYHIPIIRQETQRAYIYLGIKKGDFGVLTFFDRDTNNYIESYDTEYNGNDEQHSINHRGFSLGFVPNPSAYVYPTDVDIEIGIKDKSVKMSFTESGIAITGNVTITGNLTVSGEVKGNSIPLSTHKHTGVTSGSDTSGTPTT